MLLNIGKGPEAGHMIDFIHAGYERVMKIGGAFNMS